MSLSRNISLITVLAIGTAIGPAHFLNVSNAWAQQRTTANGSRIGPNEVTVANVDAFKAQFQHDLPIGTPKDEVETFLTRSGFRHLFIGDHIGVEFDNTFQVVLLDIGLTLGFTTTLNIWIHLDQADKVRSIDFRLQYL
jgi:hypothetical protein